MSLMSPMSLMYLHGSFILKKVNVINKRVNRVGKYVGHIRDIRDIRDIGDIRLYMGGGLEDSLEVTR